MGERSLDNADAGDEEQVSAIVTATASGSASKLPEDHIRVHNKTELQNPIILLSVCPRSGSNYLENLLSLPSVVRNL